MGEEDHTEHTTCRLAGTKNLQMALLRIGLEYRVYEGLNLVLVILSQNLIIVVGVPVGQWKSTLTQISVPGNSW